MLFDFMSGSSYLSSANQAGGGHGSATGSSGAVAKLGQLPLNSVAVIALNKDLSLFTGAARSAEPLESLAQVGEQGIIIG
jgi:hypothetical protein